MHVDDTNADLQTRPKDGGDPLAGPVRFHNNGFVIIQRSVYPILLLILLSPPAGSPKRVEPLGNFLRFQNYNNTTGVCNIIHILV